MIKKLQKNASILRCCCHKKIPPQSINALPFIIRSRYRKTALCLIADAGLSKMAFLSEFSKYFFSCSLRSQCFKMSTTVLLQLSVAVKLCFLHPKKLLLKLCRHSLMQFASWRSAFFDISEKKAAFEVQIFEGIRLVSRRVEQQRRAEADVMALEIWIFQKPACPRIDCCL